MTFVGSLYIIALLYTNHPLLALVELGALAFLYVVYRIQISLRLP